MTRINSETQRRKKIAADPAYCERRKQQQREARNRWLAKNPNYQKEWYRRNRSRVRKRVKEYRLKNIEHIRAYDNSRSAQIRQEALDAYGRFCICCGEDHEQFLTLDHFTDDLGKRLTWNGIKLFRVRGYAEYRRLKKLGWPKIVRVLCMNCNWARRRNNICPHEKSNPG